MYAIATIGSVDGGGESSTLARYLSREPSPSGLASALIGAAAGLVVGGVVGALVFRRKRR